MSGARPDPAIEAIYPLTPLQHGMLIHALEDPAGRAYVEQLACTLEGPLDVDRLERAWRLAVARHAVLRTSLVWKRGERPMQVVHANATVTLGRTTLDADVDALLAAERARGIALDKAPLMHVTVASRSDGRRHVLVWTHHHAILDGWSVPRVLGEVLAAYASAEPPPAAPTRPFADYVKWLGKRSAADGERFWRERLRGVTAPTSLVSAIPRPASDEARAPLPTQRTVRLTADVTAALLATVRREQITLATVVDAAWAALLARLARTDDVLFGVTVSGRPAELEGAETIVGLCINTIPLRTRIRPDELVVDLLARMHRELAETKPHEWTPLVDAHGWSDVPRGTSLLEGVVVVENYPAEALGDRAPPGMVVSAVRVVEETGYPWMLVVGPGRELLLRLDADPRILDGAAADAILAHLATLLEAIAHASRDRRVSELVIAPAQDRARIDGAWNATAAPGLDETTPLARVRAQATRAPDGIAVRDATGTALGYAELLRRAEHLAGRLAAEGVRPGDRVALAVRRGVRTVEAMLATWLAGAAFVPVDLRHPPARVAATLEDAAVAVLLTDAFDDSRIPHGTKVVTLDAPSDASTTRAHEPRPDDVAYVLFTSGSTGRPKGVAVRHGSVANLLESIAAALDLGPDDTWLAVTPLTFDISVLELCGPLVRGATVVVAGDDEIGDGVALARRIARERPTVLQATPSTFRMLAASGEEHPLGNARLLAGGEALNAELARTLRAGSAGLWNVYGPTETTIWSTALRVDEAEADVAGYVAIGRPLANTQTFVVDGHGGVLGAGVIGELCIAGAGVAQGYVRPEAGPRPAFATSPRGRFYRTGDRARWRADGVLVFEGRDDAQVKLRGHRIELGEIEAQLEAHDDVAQAAALVVGDLLVAHVVGRATGPALGSWLADHLPAVMIPSRFVFHEALPRTPNGKIDRGALARETAPATRSSTPRSASPTEALVCSALAEVLGLADVDPDADFFELGGHSLLATQLLARLRKVLGVEIPIRVLFEGRTARRLAARADALRAGGARPARPPLVPAVTPWEGRDAAPSYAQARLWFIDQLEPQRAFYNIPAAVRLRGALDEARLTRALDGLVARHAALRTTFHGVAGVPVQRVHPPRPVPLARVDLATLPAAGREAETRRLAEAEVQRPFDLSEDVLLRALLVRLADDDHVVVLTMHHIASDGWSIGVLIGDLVALYDGGALPALPVQMPDFAAWQRAWLEGEGRPLDAQVGYWKERLAGLAPLELPTDRPRPPIRRFRGARVPFVVPAELAASLRTFSRRSGATLFMTLLAAFDVLLARLSGQDDLAVGTPVAARIEPEVEPLVGFFANTLVVRVDLAGDPTFAQVVTRVRDASLGAHAHQDLPFEQLVATLNPVRDRSRSPLFQVMFVLQNAPRPALSATGLAFEPADAEVRTSKVDLELTMREADGGRIDGSFEIDLDLFDPETAATWARAYVTLLAEAVRTPDERASRLRVLDDAAEAEILRASRGPARDYVTDEGLGRTMDRTADRTPDAVAVVDDAGALTYAELDRAKNRIAHALLARGVRRGEPVGIAVPRSRVLIACVHACLAIGAPYVPLEPDLPGPRRAVIAADAGVRVVVTDAADAGSWADRALVASDAMIDGALPASRPDVDVRGADLAYVLYTSGSTGKPKGVVLEHAGLQNRLAWQQEALALRPDEAVLHKTPYGFDVSVWELLWPFRVGARLVVAPPGAHRDPAALVRLIAEHRITTLHFVPSMLAAFVEADGLEALTSLERIVASGEALPLDLVLRVRARLPRVRVHNLYGPTEASIDVTHFAVPDGPLDAIPIGRPIANTRAYVVDAHGRLAVPGAAGELLIAGVQVARGYLGHDERTRTAFGDDPFEPGARMYRTGDLARLRHDGMIDFLGRRDAQVKIRGHRVELSEIEVALREHPQVKEAAVVLATAQERDEPRLVAYVVPRQATTAPGTDDHVAGWRDVFTTTYGAPDEAASDPALDLRGWTSSFDGQPIPAREMQAWVDDTVARIEESKPRRILEIGCGTGLLLFRLAPRTDRYVGVDIVEETLARVATEARRRGLAQVTVRKGAAHELRADETFDAVVLNSVVQYFPDAAYLASVLEGAAATMPRGGTLFVGDVRSATLATTFAAAVELARAPAGAPLASLARAASERADEDEELLVDPRFFYRLAEPGAVAFGARIRDVRIRLKRGPAQNELTAYRYDVVLVLGDADVPAPAPPAPETRSWRDVGSVTALREAARAHRPLVVTGIPNARVERDVRAASLLAAATTGASPLRTAADLRAALDVEPAHGVDPDALEAALGDGARVVPDLDDAGALRVEIGDVPRPRPGGDLASYTTRPFDGVRAGDLARRLREHLRASLPEVMVPSAYVALRALPLTPSGKLDRARLPEPSAPARVSADGAPPATPTEVLVAAAFAEVLGVERVGRDVSFFDLGGHSLLGARLVARLAARTGRRLELRRVFEAPTVAGLAQALDRASVGADEAPLVHVDDPVAPLSYAQERLWFLEQLAPGSPTYNVPAAVRIEGQLDIAALERALADILRRHAALRVRIDVQGDAPVQHAAPAGGFVLERTDLSGLAEDVRRGAVRLACAEEARAPFDLARGPLLRARLVRLAPDDHVLSLTTHHIASDRWSLDLLVREVGVLYRHHLAGAEARTPLTPLAVDFLDYARWQRSAARTAVLDAQVERVRARLAGAPPVIALPADRPRRAPRSPQGLRHVDAIPAAVGARVDALAAAAGTTPFAVFAAGLAALLSRFGAGDDVVLGTASAGRTRPELEPLAGMFVGTVPFRLRVPDDVTLSALVAQAREEMLEALACEEAPFERVVEALAPPRSLAHEPVVQAMLVLQNGRGASLDMPGARLTLLEADTGTSKLDLTVFVEAIPGAAGAYALAFEAARDLFDPETVERLARAFVVLLDDATRHPDAPITEARIVGEHERAELLRLARGAAAAPTACVHAAIRARGESELTARVDRLARVLARAGARPGERVAVLVERSADAVVAILATLEAGAAYVPVPPSTPAVRAAAIVADAAPRIAVVQGSAPWPLPEGTVVVDVDARDEALGPVALHAASLDDLAYVLYTSGSTGTPKGVAVEHRALANHMEWMARAHPVDATDAVLVRTPLGFDASVWEPLLPLLAGARLVFAPPGTEADPEALARLVNDERVTVMQLVPTILGALVQAGVLGTMRSLRRIFAGGEALTPELRDAVLAALPGVTLVNLYGPTEATIDATSHVCGAADGPAVPIGRPIDGVRAYVLDARGELAPWGAPGELHLAGVCLARGYWRDDARTASRFVPDPFVPGERMLRTGDRVRLGGDGALVYLGRDDDQVKVGGTRLELGEIEAALAAHPDVREAAATLRDVEGEPRRLVGYVVAPSTTTAADLKAWVATRLPPAGIPAQIVTLDALPRTSSGKIDRRRLPAPPRPTSEASPTLAPAGDVERSLARVFGDVLAIADVDAGADFFELGGDSITSLQVVARARSAGIAIAPRDVFEARTVRGLAARARVAEDVAEAHRAIGDDGDLPLTPAQAMLVALAPEEPHHFNQAALVVVPPALDGAALRVAVTALVERHDALRLRMVTTEAGPRQRIEPVSAAARIAGEATRTIRLEDEAAIEPAAAAVQAEMDLERGPLFRVVHLDLGSARSGRVLLVFHHFLVDTVSWRTVEEDLLSAYAQARGRVEGAPPPRLPLPSATLHDHAAWVARAAREAPSELPFWRAQLAGRSPLPREGAAIPTEATARTTTITLDAAETRALTVDLRARTGVPVDALLLAPVLHAFASWTGRRSEVVALESHGRALEGIDLSRVVGWFTAIYPVRFDLAPGDDVLRTAHACGETLRAVPRGGVGYGILGGLPGEPLPEIGYNFLGRTARGAHAGFAPAHERPGPLRSPKARRLFLLEVLASIEDDALRLSFVWSEGVHAPQTVERLAAATLAGLRALAGSAVTAPEATASLDGSEAGLDARELERLVKKLGKKR